ncbi:MAG: hypothetical protein JNG86_07360 [Verrucomicrobiaceae bacterium]|nr:hypothetical protein [Verrucomicrobiaceae bacterium]
MLAELAQRRAYLEGLRKHMPATEQHLVSWDLHFGRLRKIEKLLRTGSPRHNDEIAELYEDFMLEMQAEVANVNAIISARFVRFTDMVARKVEEKKFELPSETRDGLEDMLLPYQEQFREKMLSSLPIETRRQIEDEDRRAREEGQS